MLGVRVLAGLRLHRHGFSWLLWCWRHLLLVPSRLPLLRRRRACRCVLVQRRVRVYCGGQLLLRGKTGHVLAVLGAKRVQWRKFSANERLAVQRGVSLAVSGGDPRSNRVRFSWVDNLADIIGSRRVPRRLVRSQRNRGLHAMPRWLLLHGWVCHAVHMRLRHLQRARQRHVVGVHSVHVRAGLLFQFLGRDAVRRHGGQLHRLLRRHGLRGRLRAARALQRGQFFVARRDVGGVHILRGRRQLRPLHGRHFLHHGRRRRRLFR